MSAWPVNGSRRWAQSDVNGALVTTIGVPACWAGKVRARYWAGSSS
jgi:hypothetical protein